MSRTAETLASGLFAERYDIVRLLGEGGMGSVYEARDRVRGRRVALKLVSPHQTRAAGGTNATNADDATARFQREMRITASLEHPNTVRLYDFGVYENRPYLTMELVQGTSLSAAMRSPTSQAGVAFSLDRAILLCAQIARALSAAHAKNIVHRDLKPDNIMLIRKPRNREIAKVLDFGVATITGAEGNQLTRAGMIVGTPAYMPPEQVLGRAVDARSDLYALGLILFELVAGRRPFPQQSAMPLMLAHVRNDAPRLGTLVENVPPELDQLVHELLQKDPADRPGSALDVERRLVLMSPAAGADAAIKDLAHMHANAKAKTARAARAPLRTAAIATALVAASAAATYSRYNRVRSSPPPAPLIAGNESLAIKLSAPARVQAGSPFVVSSSGTYDVADLTLVLVAADAPDDAHTRTPAPSSPSGQRTRLDKHGSGMLVAPRELGSYQLRVLVGTRVVVRTPIVVSQAAEH